MPNPTNSEQVEAVTQVFDAVDRLSERERLAIGLSHGAVNKARAAIESEARQGETVDHRDAAEGALRAIGGIRENGSLELAPIAQVHATLALVDEVAKLRVQLESDAVEVVYGGRTV